MRTFRFSLGFSLILAAPVLTLAFGCQDDTSIKTVEAKMSVDPTHLDFGRVQVGTTATQQIFVRNTGDGVLNLQGVNRGTPFDDAYTFSIDRTAIQPSGVATISVTFSPTEIGQRAAQLIIKSADPKVTDQPIDLAGEGVTTTVTIDPISLSYGNVVVHTSKTLAVTLNNTSDIDAKIQYIAGLNVKLCTSGGSDPATFCVASRDRPLGADSSFTLPAGQMTQIEVSFKPEIAGTRDRANFTLKTCALPVCETQIQLDGVGVNQAFVCDPPALDFGNVNPGSCASQSVSCKNIANDPLTVLGWATGQAPSPSSPDFTLSAPVVQVLNQEESLSIDATYCPHELGDDHGTIEIETDNRDPQLRFVVVSLTGSGGGPNITVVPSQLNFGLVSLIAPARRTITIQNVGYADLMVGSIVVDGLGTGAFSSPDTAVPAIPPGGFHDLTIEFQPVIAGPVMSELIIPSNDGDQPEVRIPLLGEGINLPPCTFEIAPPQVAFGVVERARTLSRSFEIRNTGANDCLVTSARMVPGSDQEFSLPDGDVQSLIIPMGSATTIRVAYAPTMAGDNQGTVEFSISSPRSPFNEVALTGTGADATLLIVPNDIDFGVIGVGCDARARTVTIYNTGTTPAHINSIGLASPPETAFSITNITPQPPFDVTAGSSATFDVSFHAAAISSYSGAVQIDGTFGGMPVTYIVSLQGRGDVDATQTDNFEQLGRPSVDVLFVVDNSCSMSDKQAALAANFASFIQFASAQGLDYRIAITTTDVDPGGEDGRFVPLNGGTTVVTPATQPSPDAVFTTNINVGTLGSGFEQGLEGAFEALSPPNIFMHNSGFLRLDAVLSIIFVSDAEDQSSSPVDFYTNFFLSIKGFRNTNLFTASAISQVMGDTCGELDFGGRYQEVANRTGGIYTSICTTDWARSLQELSTTAFGFKSRFFLTNQPVISSIHVFIDGVEMPATSPGGTVNWTYDYGTNAVNFSPFSIPEPGAQIRVEYTVECL